MVGLMYRLVLHEFAGPVPYYLFRWLRRQPGLPRRRHCLLDTGRRRDAAVDAIRLPAVLHGLPAIPLELREAAGARWRTPLEILRFIELPLMLPTIVDRLLRPLHRRLPGVRQRLRADRQRGRAARPPRCRSTSTRRSSSRARSARRSRPRSCCFVAVLRRALMAQPAWPAAGGLSLMLKALRWIVFCVAVLAINFPVIVTLVTSFKSAARNRRSIRASGSSAPTLANYLGVLSRTDRFNIYAYLWNSLVASAVGTGVAVLLALPAAYAIAQRRRRASGSAAARHQSARGAADHLRHPALHDVPVARPARHPARASA